MLSGHGATFRNLSFDLSPVNSALCNRNINIYNKRIDDNELSLDVISWHYNYNWQCKNKNIIQAYLRLICETCYQNILSRPNSTEWHCLLTYIFKLKITGIIFLGIKFLCVPITGTYVYLRDYRASSSSCIKSALT